jgi:hypothetical protein
MKDVHTEAKKLHHFLVKNLEKIGITLKFPYILCWNFIFFDKLDGELAHFK